MEEYMESELSGIFLVKLVTKNIVSGCPGTQFMHMRVNLASVSENSILTILKSTQVSKAAGLVKDGAKFLAKPINDLCHLSINSEKFLTFAK